MFNQRKNKDVPQVDPIDTLLKGLYKELLETCLEMIDARLEGRKVEVCDDLHLRITTTPPGWTKEKDE